MKKIITVLLSVVFAISCGVMTVLFASATEEAPSLEITGLTAGNFYGAGNGNYVYLGNESSSWVEQDASYFAYVNAQGENKLGRVTSWNGFLVINFQNEAAKEGDEVTIKKGFTWGEKELKADVTFKFESGAWIQKNNPAQQIAVGDVWLAQGDCFSIYLTDNNQTFSRTGWIGSDTTFAFYDSDWGHNFVNDINKVYFVNGDKKYNARSIRYYNDTSFRALQIYFSTGCDFASALNGSMLCIDENFLVNTNDSPVYTFGEAGTYYSFVESGWKKVSLATDAQIILDASVSVGATATVGYTFAEGSSAPVLSYVSSNENIATVSQNGVVTGVAEGSAEITVNFKGFSKTTSIEVTKALTPTSISVEIIDEIYNENGALVAYVGETIDKAKLADILNVKYGYDNETYSSPFKITSDNISLEGFDNSKVGKSLITVTYNGFTTTLNVNVYEIASVNAPSVNNVDFWASAIMINFSSLTADFDNVNWQVSDETLAKLKIADYIDFKAANKNGGTSYVIHSVNYLYSRDIALSFENKGKNDLLKGDVLTFKQGMRMYKRVGTAYIALFALSNDFTVVWSGSDWVEYTAEAESIEVEETELTLPVGALQEIAYSVLPNGSYAEVTITSSDSDSVAIAESGNAIKGIKKTETPVEITIKLGNDETTKKVIKVKVVELEIVGFEIYDKRDYNVSKGEDLTLKYYLNDQTVPNKLCAMAVYSDGSTGIPFELNLNPDDGDVNVKISNYDKNVAGTQNVTLDISNGGKEFSTQLTVKVKDSVAQVSDLLMQDPFGGAPLKFYISFVQTAKNEINIPTEISAAYEIEKYIAFQRGNEQYPVKAVFNGQFLVVETLFPETVAASDRVYKTGDKIILAKGLPILQWMGDSSNYNPIGAGEYVVAGKVEYEIVYEHSDPVSKSWETYIQYVGIELAGDTVEIGFGKLKDLGATMIPAYATVGEFKIVSSDPSIASVNANGLVKGEKIGATTLTVTLSGGTNGDITRTVTVKVVDVVTGIKFNKTIVYIDEGTVALNGQLLKDKGVEGVLVWASGKEEGIVDLSAAKFIGYSANKEGEQEVTIRATVDGVSVTGKIKVIIGEEKNGCGSAVSANISLLAMFALGGVILLKRKNQ